MQISLNGINKQMLTTNMGIKRTHSEYQDHIKVIGTVHGNNPRYHG